MPVTSVDRRPLQPCPICHHTAGIQMVVSVHRETIHFIIMSSDAAPLSLGYPWLQHHDPHISWSTKQILQWGPNCPSSCFLCRPDPTFRVPPTTPSITDNLLPPYRDLARFPRQVTFFFQAVTVLAFYGGRNIPSQFGLLRW